MEMCYDGALVMPQNYALLNEEEMTYVEGGGTFSVEIGDNSFVMTALASISGTLTTAKVTAVLGSVGVAIATAIELGTAGTGTLIAGAFILAWGGIVSSIAGIAVTYGLNSLKGKKWDLVTADWCPNYTFKI